jgi:hypothetical protein
MIAFLSLVGSQRYDADPRGWTVNGALVVKDIRFSLVEPATASRRRKPPLQS